MDMNTILEKAVASADPAVRGVAIRFRRLEHEMVGLNTFLATYGEGLEEAATTLSTQKQKTAPVHAKPNGSTGARLTSDDFTMRVKTVLTGNGGPLGISALYEAFFTQYPDQTKVSSESFRQKLVKRRNLIDLLPGRAGYWPIDVPLPDGVSTEEPIAA